MSHQEEVSQWTHTLSMQFTHLSRPQVTVLACWSYALNFLHRCGLSRASLWLALALGGKPGARPQRLHEWCYDAQDKKREQRRDLQVDQCFAPLLRWVLSWWKTEDQRVILVLDSSTLADRFMMLAISVAYRGRAIPIAWHLRAAGQPGSWQQEWLRLLASLQGIIPADWTVLVMADRGLYARWLYRAIRASGMAPLLAHSGAGDVPPNGRGPLCAFVQPGAARR